MRGIAEKSVGVNREAIKIATKMLSQCKHFAGAAHGTSKDSHGGMSKLLVGWGQGFLASACRDV